MPISKGRTTWMLESGDFHWQGKARGQDDAIRQAFLTKQPQVVGAVLAVQSIGRRRVYVNTEATLRGLGLWHETAMSH